DLDIDNLIPGDDALFHRLLDSLLDRGNEVPRDGPSEDLVDELVAPAERLRAEFDPAVAVLAAPPGLPLVLPLHAGVPAHRLPVRNAGHRKGHLRPELPLQAVGDN